MDHKDRIAIDPNVRFGKVCVRGTRITTGDVLSYLASGMSESEILADSPVLTHEDILAFLLSAAARRLFDDNLSNRLPQRLAPGPRSLAKGVPEEARPWLWHHNLRCQS
jgi:uncharacterized protein (DUF433 family)